MAAKNTHANETEKNLQPPRPAERPHKMEKHGDVRMDPYFWLRERENKDVVEYLNKENDYVNKILKPTEKLQKTIFTEMKSRIVEDESSAPYKKGPFYYFTRYKKGTEYPVFVRYAIEEHKKTKRKEAVFLDGNAMAKGLDYFDLGAVVISPNHNIAAYSVDTVGRRFYKISFKNLQTGENLKDSIPNTTGSLIWANDNQTVYYTMQHPETLRSFRVYRKKLGEKPELIFEEKDELFSVGLDKSLNGKTLFIVTGGMTANEVRFADADATNPTFQIFYPREDKHEYSVEDGDDRFYVVTNWKAKNFRLMECEKDNTDRKSWQQLLAHRQDVLVENVSVFKDHLVFSERTNGLTQIVYSDRDLKKMHRLSFPEKAYMASLGSNAEYDADTIRYVYESMISPMTVYDLNVKTGEATIVKEKQVPNYIKTKYESERLWATAHDGEKIPVSLIYNKKLFKKGENPLLVYGYGSYGYSLDPDFSSAIFSLLDRGFVFAFAHIRGGSEMGRHWYEDGKFLKKKNTFKDFISVTEFLLQKKFGDKKRTYAMGGSAGGLLMGAVMNMRSDLYHGVVAQVPFVDVITTMLDESIPLTTIEYEEWGNPNDPKFYKYMRSYSPYDNVKPTEFPNTLIMSGFHDSQVQYWEPTKWAAKLRDNNTAESLILLKTDMESGHSGATGRYKSLIDTSIEYAFLVWLAESKQ